MHVEQLVIPTEHGVGIGEAVTTRQRFLFFSTLYPFLSTMTQLAPAPALDFSINADQVKQITKDIIDEELRVNNEIAALKPEDRTYENIVPKLARIENTLSGNISYESIPCCMISNHVLL